MSIADKIFVENIKDILQNGWKDDGVQVRPHWEDGTPAHTIKKFCVVNRYDLRKEFPVITVRKTFFKNCIDEMLWIWQRKSNDISQLNSKIWDSWADEKGTIGKAYGYQLAQKSRYPEGEFDQVDRMLFDLKNNPYSRRIMANMYVHSDLAEMNLYPCAYSFTLNVTGNVLNGLLNQRSQDMMVANNWNVAQYAALLCMFAKVNGLVAGELVHVIADAHIYDRHVPVALQLIEKPQFEAPEFVLADKTDFYDFDVEDFKLKDYKYNEFNTKLEVAI